MQPSLCSMRSLLRKELGTMCSSRAPGKSGEESSDEKIGEVARELQTLFFKKVGMSPGMGESMSESILDKFLNRQMLHAKQRESKRAQKNRQKWIEGQIEGPRIRPQIANAAGGAGAVDCPAINIAATRPRLNLLDSRKAAREEFCTIRRHRQIRKVCDPSGIIHNNNI